MSTTHNPGLSEDQLLSLPDIGKAEMIDGKVIMTPTGSEHGGISMRLGSKLVNYVEPRRLGVIFDSSTGFWMRSGNLLSPDVSFVAAGRLKGMKRLPRTFFQGSPDLAAEVLSPHDRPEEVRRKIQEYFESNTRLVWVLQPEDRTAEVYRRPANPADDVAPEKTLDVKQWLEGEEILPGFTLPLRELFTEPDFG